MKHYVDLDPPLPYPTLCDSMPIWFHKGQDQEKWPQNNGKWAKCQRHNHKILIVGEINTYMNETQGLWHSSRINCSCTPCRAAQSQGCENPIKCWKATQKLLKTLYPKWEPTGMENVDSLNLNDDELQQNEQAWKSGNPQIFNQNVMSSPTFTNEFCVFARPRPTQTSVATRAIHDHQQDKEPVIVSICGVHKNTNYENAKSTYAIWYREDDPWNITCQTKGNSQTKEAGEYQAILETLSQTPDQAKLHVNVTLAHIKDMLTSHLPRSEDNGWIGIPNNKILQAIVATLHACKGRTIIGKIQGQAV